MQALVFHPEKKLTGVDCRESEMGQVRLRVGGEKANTEQSRLQCDAANLLYNMNKTNESSLFFLIDIR